jgi:hypothetical protein
MIYKGSAKIKHTIDGFGMAEIMNQDPIISFGVGD